jgi:hypothetical protein
MHRGSRSDGRRPQNSPSTFRTTTITTIAPMMYRIEYIGTSFLSLRNAHSGPCFGVPSLLRTGALPLDAGKRQAHHRRAHIPRVLWTQIHYSTWPRACHERFVMLMNPRGDAYPRESQGDSRRWPRATSMRRAARVGPLSSPLPRHGAQHRAA